MVDSLVRCSRRVVTQPRPGTIALAAWSFIVAGVAKVVGLPLFVRAIADEAAFLSSDQNAPPLAPEWLARAAGFVAGHLNALVAFWVLLGLLMIAGAAGLRRQRPWARVALEAVCWFGIFEAPLVAAFIYSVRAMLLRAGAAGGDSLAASLVPRFWVGLAWLGIYVILLILLRRTDQGDGAHGQAEGQSEGTRG